MPTYQYACTACDERLEAVQSFTDAPLTQCPACGGALRKVFSAVGVVFKGSGFYKTDSRAKSSSGSGEGSAAKPGESSGAAAKTESKSETKTESTSKSEPKAAAKAPAATSGTGSSN